MHFKISCGNIIFALRNDATVGVDYGEGTPVPIPNTEVKLTGAEDTRSETTRENRLMPTQITDHRTVVGLYALIAQSVEHAAVNRGVVGSSPT